MHLSSSRLALAATDLGRFLACRHLTGLDIEVALGKCEAPPKYPDPFLELLIQRGLAHEKGCTGKIEKGGLSVLDLSGFNSADAVARTIGAMKAGRPAIAQGALAADVDLMELSRQFPVSGIQIRTTALRAASAAAQRDGKGRVIRRADPLEVAGNVGRKESPRTIELNGLERYGPASPRIRLHSGARPTIRSFFGRSPCQQKPPDASSRA